MNPIFRRVCVVLLLPVCLFWNRSLMAAEAAAVVLDPAGVVDLGNVLSTEVRHVTFKVVNKTEKPIKIKQVRTTCACTVPKEPPADPVPPGGSVELSLELTGAKLAQGPFERSVTIILSDAPVSYLTFQFKGNMVEPIVVRPGRQIRFPPAKTPDETWGTKIIITGNFPKGQQLRLDQPVAGERLLTELKETAPSAYELTVRPKLPQAMGQYTEEIKISVLEPKDSAPIIITGLGQVGPVLSVAGGTINVRQGTDGQPVSKVLSLYQLLPVLPATPGAMPPRERVLPSEITFKTPPGVTATVEDFRNRTRMVLTFSPELKPGTQGVVEIQSKCCGTTSVKFVIGEKSATEDKKK